ncbi:MAG: hypothetical protein ACI8T1_004557, partial [Verrucomicrobiales bacterium]
NFNNYLVFSKPPEKNFHLRSANFSQVVLVKLPK